MAATNARCVMSGIEQLLQEPVAQAIGWALLHFVWQGALVGILAAVALALLRRSAADVRYVVGAIALAVMATLPLVTAVQSYHAEESARTETTWDGAPTVRSHQADSLAPLPTTSVSIE